MAAQVLGSSTKREGGTSIRAQGGLPVVEDKYHFIVLADSVDEPYDNIRNAQGLPKIGDAFGPVMRVVAVEANRRPNAARYWDATVTVSTNVEEGQDSFDPTSDPTVWVPVRETKLERLTEALVKTKDNEAIVNSAGQGYEQGLLIPRYIPVWEFYQFEPVTVTDETIADRCETINDRVFKGRPKQTLLLNVESSVLGFFYGRRLRLTFYTLKFNKENWLHKRLDGGTWYLSGAAPNQTRKAFKDDDDDAVHFGLLDGSGGKLPIGDDPVFNEFEIYDELDFASFLRI